VNGGEVLMYKRVVTFLLVQGTALRVKKVREPISAIIQSAKLNKTELTYFSVDLQMSRLKEKGQMQNLIALDPDTLQYSYEKHKSNGLKL
jgi:hypothetical protein